MKRHAIVFAVLLALFCALPVAAAPWWNTNTKRLHASGGSTEHAAAGWVRLTPAQYAAVAGVPQRYLKDVGGLPVEMSAGEKTAVDLVRTRSTARSRMLSAVSELLASQEIQTRLIAAGKDTTKIAARIAAIDSNIATALGNHPDAP